MRKIVATSMFVLLGCSAGEQPAEQPTRAREAEATPEPSPKPPTPEPSPQPTPEPSPKPAPPAYQAPVGKVQGTEFAPDVVMLEVTSDGSILSFGRLRADRRDRLRCSGFELTTDRMISIYLPAPVVETGKGELEIQYFSGTDIPFHNPVAGKASVELTQRDAAGFRVAGTIAIAADDGSWSFTGPFAGDYCPSKVVAREQPEPLLGLAWTLGAVDPTKLPSEPLRAIVAGTPTAIPLVTLREAKKYDGTPLHRLVFYTRERSAPCAERPYGGGGELASEPNDSFAIDLTLAPSVGATLAGHHSGDDEARGPFDGADLRVFEPDGYRSWIYSQYFGVALAIDELADTRMKGRVFLALPDTGKSMLAGAFEALRCPPEP